MDKMLEEFEVWAEGQGYATDKYDESELSDKYKNLAGLYVIPETRFMLEVWKASRAALCVELPMVYSDQFNEDSYYAPAVRNAIDASGVSHK